MIRKRSRKILYRFVLPYGGLLLVNLLSLTYRVRIVGPENERDPLLENGSIIYASWHQRFFPGIRFFSKRRPIAIMISRSRDGDFISRIVEILGWHPVRGSSTHGGTAALQELKLLAKRGHKIGHIVDGPKGPFGVVKPGLLRIAQVAGIPIVPTITSAEKKWVFSSWDRFMIPKPFSRVTIRFGEPIRIPFGIGPDAFENKRLKIENRLKELYIDTDRMWPDRSARTETTIY